MYRKDGQLCTSAEFVSATAGSKSSKQATTANFNSESTAWTVDVIAELLSNANGTINIRTSGTDRKTSIQALELFFHMSPKVEVR